jgi:hypothetical protein
MKEFLMVFRNAVSSDFEPTPEQQEAVDKQWLDWFGGIIEQGKYAGGQRPGMEGKTISAGNIVTDGPYAEVKEIILGTAIIKADTIDEIVDIAKGCTVLLVGGTVEVRDLIIMEM